MSGFTNKQIRIALIMNDMNQYDLAKLLKYSEAKTSKMLREELPEHIQDYIVDIIMENGKEK